MATPDNSDFSPTRKLERAPSTKDYPDETGACKGNEEQRAAPRQIGRYPVVRQLGAGAFGIVYLAQDESLERRVAIKVLNDRRLRSDEHVELFLAEARKAAKLKHPGIVAIHDMGQDPDSGVYVVMEFVEGQTLAELLRSHRPNYTEAARLVARVADAVHYAHTCGLVHRDLKPANVLIDKDGLPHVADFGLALEEKEQQSHAGELSGSPPYMSPEQVRGDVHRLDGRSDIWSLGAILYEALSGRPPFSGKMAHLFDEILNREAKPLRMLDRHIPKKLEEICLKALAKAPTDRFSTAVDMADAIWRALPEGSATASKEEWVRPAESRQREISARLDLHRTGCAMQVAVASVVLLIVGLCSVAYYAREQTRIIAAAERQVAAAADESRRAKQLALEAERERVQLRSERARFVKSLPNQYDQLADAVRELGRDPESQEAHTVLGRYLCFTAGNWKDGLPHLAKGGDSVLRQLAQKELAGAASPDAMVRLADGWYDAALRETGRAQTTILSHSRSLYAATAPKLSDESKNRVEQRITDIDALLREHTGQSAGS